MTYLRYPWEGRTAINQLLDVYTRQTPAACACGQQKGGKGGHTCCVGMSTEPTSVLIKLCSLGIA